MSILRIPCRRAIPVLLVAASAASPAKAIEMFFLTSEQLVGRVTLDPYLGNADDLFLPGLNTIGAATQFAGTNTTYGFLGGSMDVKGVTPFGLQDRQYFGISTHTMQSLYGEWNSDFFATYNNPFTQTHDSSSPSVITLFPDQTYTTSFVLYDSAYDGHLAVTGTGSYLRSWQSPFENFGGDELTHFETILPLLPQGWAGVAHELQSWEVLDGPQAGVTGVTTTTFYTFDWNGLPDQTTPVALGAPWVTNGYAAVSGTIGAQLGSPYTPAIDGSAVLEGGVEAALGFIGLGAVGSGALTVQGAGTVLHADDPVLSVVSAFGQGDGSIKVLDGGVLETGQIFRAGAGGFDVLVDGAGSRLVMQAPDTGIQTIVGLIDQGFFGAVATTQVLNGGQLEILAQGEQDAWLVLFAPHEVTIDGPTSALHIQGAENGTRANQLATLDLEQGATLRVLNGARVEVDAPSAGIGAVTLGAILAVDQFSTAAATLLIDGSGSHLEATDQISVGTHFDFDPVTGMYTASSVPGGTSVMTVRNGGTAVAERIIIGSNGTLNGSGGTLIGAVENGGTVAVGESPGVMHIEGDFTQTAGGRLVIEIGGTVPGVTYDLLEVSGTATLGGTLEIVLLDGYQPGQGETFNFLTALALTGRFDELLLPLLDDGQRFTLSFGPGGIAAAVTAVPLPGAAWLFAAGAGFLLRRRTHR